MIIYFQSWGDFFTQSLQNVGFSVLGFIPRLIGAVILFALGWILAVLVEKLIGRVQRLEFYP